MHRSPDTPSHEYPVATIDGIWEMVRAELDGEAAPELVTRQTILELRGRTYEVRYAGQVVDRGTVTPGDTIPHATLILRGESGPNAGRTIPCIYQLAGDRLRVCYGLDRVLPSDFATATGQQRYLAAYRRRTASMGSE